MRTGAETQENEGKGLPGPPTGPGVSAGLPGVVVGPPGVVEGPPGVVDGPEGVVDGLPPGVITPGDGTGGGGETPVRSEEKRGPKGSTPGVVMGGTPGGGGTKGVP